MKMRSQLFRLRHLGIVALSALLPVPVSAYAQVGRDGDSQKQAASKTTKVSVVLKDFSIEIPEKLQAGETTFEITNKGRMEHSLEIESGKIQKKLESRVAPGETATLTVALQPGEYHIYCPVDDHAKRGMSTQVSVTSPTRR